MNWARWLAPLTFPLLPSHCCHASQPMQYKPLCLQDCQKVGDCAICLTMDRRLRPELVNSGSICLLVFELAHESCFSCKHAHVLWIGCHLRFQPLNCHHQLGLRASSVPVHGGGKAQKQVTSPPMSGLGGWFCTQLGNTERQCRNAKKQFSLAPSNVTFCVWTGRILVQGDSKIPRGSVSVLNDIPIDPSGCLDWHVRLGDNLSIYIK